MLIFLFDISKVSINAKFHTPNISTSKAIAIKFQVY